MNPSSPALPNLWSLRKRDTIIERTQNMAVFGIIAAIGFKWANQPVPGQPPNAATMEASTVWLICLGALVFSAISALFMLRRYLLVRKILSQGTIIKGMVDDITISSHQTNSDSDTTSKPTYSRSYYAHVRYTFLETERKVKLRLPSAGFVFGLVKGRETDLIILESLPKKPLIRSIYLGNWTK